MKKLVLLGLMLPLSLFSTCHQPDPSTTEGLWWLLYYERFDAFSENLDFYKGDIDTTDKYNQTFLEYMSHFPEPDIIKKLIEKGADVNKTSPRGNSALRAAAYKDNVEVAKVLINAGAEIDILDEDKETPLHMAAKRNCSKVIPILLNHGANPKLKDKYGWTPLQLLLRSSSRPSKYTVELVLKHGADPNYRNPNPVYPDSSMGPRPKAPRGNAPLEIAKNGGYDDIITLLRKYGATE